MTGSHAPVRYILRLLPFSKRVSQVVCQVLHGALHAACCHLSGCAGEGAAVADQLFGVEDQAWQ